MSKTAASIQATGRRKTSVASVRMQSGSGAIKVNGRDFTDYFGSISLQNQILRPLEIANAIHSYDVSVKTTGGGINGQAGALRLALSRALLEVDEALRLPLKQEGLLTRDPRMKERKKPGRPGARKRFQFSKR
jgi:small subunit ribosomal protein S9